MAAEEDPKQGLIRIHNHDTEQGTRQRAAVAEMVRLGVEEEMSYDDIASTIMVKLLNPPH